MSRSSKIYAYIVSVIGLSLGSYCVYLYFRQILTQSNSKQALAQFGVLTFLYIICRCLPIYIRDDYSIDMSFVCNLASIFCYGPIFSAAMVTISTPFIIIPTNTGERTFTHIFNREPIKTAFNAGNITTSAFIASLLYQKAGGVVGDFSLPQILLPLVVASFSFILLNCSILMLLFTLNGQGAFFPALLKNLWEFMPNIAASAPIAYFIAKILVMENGVYLVLFFMLPLLLARYSFVLYLAAKANYYNMVKTLTAALEAKDKYTEGHSHRVEEYAEMIARKMHYHPGDIDDIKVAALLHDVGKIGIDEKILNKPGPLTPEERAVIMTHPVISASILKNVKLNDAVREAILHHHERYDGGGYPDHTKGEEISTAVYVIGVADAYDAMTSDRPYCASMPVERVVEILKEESGKQFHPKVVCAFLEALREQGVIS